MSRRVVITGVGIVSSAGSDRASFLEAVAAGRSCLSPVNDPRYHPVIRVMAGLLRTLPDAPALPPDWPVPDRFVHLALAAADQAMRQTGLTPDGMGRRAGVVVGTCSGPTTLIEEFYQSVLDGKTGLSAAQAFRTDYGSAARVLSQVFNLHGFSGTVTTACSAGLTAIGTGADLIRSGLCEVVLAGGADAYNISTQIGFDGLKAPSDGPSAPFSRPVGLCLGEGAAFLVLEEMICAQHRGSPVLGEILGFGTGNDAYHCSSPDPSGAGQSLAVVRALKDAGLDAGRIGYVNAHGTGTAANDKAETKALRRVFGARAAALPVSSQKAVFGHTLGAAGALETAATLLCQEAGVLPPTANFAGAREGCDLDYVPESGRPWPADPQGSVWLKENFAFGGHDASLVLGEFRTGSGAREQAGPPARVCLAGIGVVSPGGVGRDAFARLLDGSGAVLQECSPAGHASFKAALVPDNFDPALERRLGLRRMDRAAALGTVAAHMALAEATVALRPDMLAEVGLYLAHATASNAAEAAFVPDLLKHDYAIQSVADFPFVVPNATAGTISRTLGLKGHHAVFCSGEGAGLMSLVTGTLAVQNRHASCLLAGAVDVLRSRGWSVPLPAGGLVPAEGAVFFLLEEEEHLRRRGGHSLGVVEGVAVAATAAKGWTEGPSRAEVDRVAAEALRQAGLEPGRVAVATGPAADVTGGAPLAVMTQLGFAESCNPLFELAAALARPGGGPDGILGSVSSRQGWTASVVVRAGSSRG